MKILILSLFTLATLIGCGSAPGEPVGGQEKLRHTVATSPDGIEFDCFIYDGGYPGGLSCWPRP